MHDRSLTAAVTLAILAACMIGCSNPYTPAGHEGYVFERPRVFGKGGYRGVIKGPGNFGVSAFRNEVINIDLRPQTYSETFKILAKDDHEEVTAEHRIRMLSMLTEASGAHGMAGGQAVDLASVGRQLSLEQLEHMHQLKTGALIRASVLLGGMCKPGISEREIGILDQYSRCIGLSFQIQDDILDVVGDTETLGKPQGSDQAQDKPTFPAIIGLDESRKLAQQQHDSAMKILEPLDKRADSLRELSAYIVERDY